MDYDSRETECEHVNEAYTSIQTERRNAEQTPILNNSGTMTTRSYKNMTRFRVTSILIPVLFFAGLIPNTSLLPEYLLHRLAQDAGTNVSQGNSQECQGNQSDASGSDEYQKDASTYMWLYSTVQNGCALLMIMLIGGFADVLGRRPFILMGTFSGFLRLLLTSLIIKFDLPLWVFYIANAVDGLAGSWFSIFLGLYAGVADMNELKSSRVLWIAVIGACLGLDSAVFMVVTGFAVDALGFFWASMIGTITSGLSVLIAFFLLPETYFPKNKKFNFNVFNNLLRIFRFFISDGSIRKRIGLTMCIFSFFFLIINMVGTTTMDTLYQQNKPFCWKPFTIGLYSGARMGGQFVLGTVALKLFAKFIAVEWIAVAGIMFQAAGFGFEAFVSESWQFFLVPVIGFLGATAIPVVRGVMSSLVASSDQGAIFSSIAVIEVGCQLIGNTVLLRVYTSTVSSMPGAVYLLMGSISVAALLLLLMFQITRENVQLPGSYETIVECDDSNKVND